MSGSRIREKERRMAGNLWASSDALELDSSWREGGWRGEIPMLFYANLYMKGRSRAILEDSFRILSYRRNYDPYKFFPFVPGRSGKTHTHPLNKFWENYGFVFLSPAQLLTFWIDKNMLFSQGGFFEKNRDKCIFNLSDLHWIHW